MQIITHPKHAQNISKAERVVSVVAGGILLVSGFRRGRTPIGMSLLGAELIRRGATGRCYAYDLLGISTASRGQGGETTSVPYQVGIRVDSSITINRTPIEVYQFWRNLENMPRFMRHVKSIHVIDDRRSHWVVKGPGGTTVDWDAEIINEIPGELIGWRSLEGSKVQNAGSVRFKPAPGGRGTLVQVELQYNPPAGLVGATVARFFGEEPTSTIHEDLHRLKQVMEAGEVPTTEGQSAGQRETEQGVR